MKALSIVIALPTIAIIITLYKEIEKSSPLLFGIAFMSDNYYCRIVARAITIWEAIEKRSHEPMYKTDIKMKQRD